MSACTFPAVRIGTESLNSLEHKTAVHAAASGELVAWQQIASAAQIDQAVLAARAALPEWHMTAPALRGALLQRVAALVEAQRESLVQIQMQVNGKPRFEANCDVSDVAACFAYYAELCREGDAFASAPVPVPDTSVAARRRYEAVGVAALVVPWNFPMVTTAWKLAPALAAGCTVVLKPSELTSPAEHALFELLNQAGVPAGVVSLVNGGAPVGAALVAHPMIDKISFTGSTAVGKQIMRSAADGLKRTTLELGGKSALIVREDADLELAVQLAIGGAFTNAGQMCSATSRILVHHSLYDRFMKDFQSTVQALIVAPPSDPTSAMGPLISDAHRSRVQALVEQGIAAGAEVAFSGQLAGTVGSGHFMAPLVIAAPDEHNILWRDEIFGPVACVRSFDNDAQALAIANSTAYGLVATVVTESEEAAAKYETQLRAGLVWINTPQLIFPQVCWGGLGASGIGRELGLQGLRSYQELRHAVHLTTG
ncbi:aldehyde dehydrogenase family protein [Paucibacter sp. JuS9]|uniref:aldehyde dehydrogenase family protein n=1 Tax=Paucibacter sp. JuS9 TaxID=3228748 RepID=UPI0037566B67